MVPARTEEMKVSKLKQAKNQLNETMGKAKKKVSLSESKRMTGPSFCDRQQASGTACRTFRWTPATFKWMK